MPDTTLRVVVIDDDPSLLTAVTDLLGEYGIQVTATATDGCQALTALISAADQHGSVDALILDERMPHTSGIQAARLVRRYSPTLPIILYTAYAHMLGDAPQTAGVTAQVSKGDHPLALVQAIRGACTAPVSLVTNGGG